MSKSLTCFEEQEKLPNSPRLAPMPRDPWKGTWRHRAFQQPILKTNITSSLQQISCILFPWRTETTNNKGSEWSRVFSKEGQGKQPYLACPQTAVLCALSLPVENNLHYPHTQLPTSQLELIGLGRGGALDSRITTVYRLASGLRHHLIWKSFSEKGCLKLGPNNQMCFIERLKTRGTQREAIVWEC